MACLAVLPVCGLRPLPRIFPKSRYDSVSFSPSSLPELRISRTALGRCSISLSVTRERTWALRASFVMSQEVEDEVSCFDPGASPQFKLSGIRAPIPKHCWVKDPWKSMGYVVRDAMAVFGLAAVAVYANSWFVWPICCLLKAPFSGLFLFLAMTVAMEAFLITLSSTL
ncbi:unnamed protein product [Cuscuta campestris]|uniref:Fatty acid desaturase N-terminal domain-containing protein n=1 Tax=Cuscuta campestris TaxID=132261 RepID=A0A484L935_9ASTE|nr:unnamed protein product [Cuscuta campestris]